MSELLSKSCIISSKRRLISHNSGVNYWIIDQELNSNIKNESFSPAKRFQARSGGCEFVGKRSKESEEKVMGPKEGGHRPLCCWVQPLLASTSFSATLIVSRKKIDMSPYSIRLIGGHIILSLFCILRLLFCAIDNSTIESIPHTHHCGGGAVRVLAQWTVNHLQVCLGATPRGSRCAFALDGAKWCPRRRSCGDTACGSRRKNL